MATDEQWGRNLRTAKRAFEERHDAKITYREIGERVAAEAGRATAFGHSAVLNWFENGQEPESFSIIRALAAVLETSVSTLLASDAPLPPLPSSALRPIALADRPSKQKKRRA